MFADHKSIVLHKKSDNSLKDTYFNRLSDKMNGYFTIHGTTLVNLLGKYGNFETDTNADGLADGWTLVRSDIKNISNSGVFDSKGQYIKYTHLAEDGATKSCDLFRAVNVSAVDVIWWSSYAKKGNNHTAATTQAVVTFYNGASYLSSNSLDITSILSTSWKRFSEKLTCPATTTSMRLYLPDGVTSADSTEVCEMYHDGAMVINLTELGALDTVRAAKYGVANWADLTEAQLEAEIPYFDSVMSVNVADGTASELTIENRGKNLIKLPEGTSLAGVEVTTTGNKVKISGVTTSGGMYFILTTDFCGVVYGISENKIKKLFRKTLAKAGTYTASLKNLVGVIPDYFTIAPHDNTGNIILGCALDENNTEDTFTTTVPIAGFLFYFGVHTNIDVEFNFQLEEGSAATAYVPPRTDSITIPDTVELHGYNGVFNSLEYEGDSVANYTQRWKREDKNTDGGGAFALTDYKTDTKIICRNKTTGEVKVLDADDSVDTDWNSITAEVWYVLDEAVESIVDLTDNGYRLPKLMNQIVVDSNLPIAMLINYEESVGYLHTQNFLEE